jgi:hypothetical protein
LISFPDFDLLSPFTCWVNKSDPALSSKVFVFAPSAPFGGNFILLNLGPAFVPLRLGG